MTTIIAKINLNFKFSTSIQTMLNKYDVYEDISLLAIAGVAVAELTQVICEELENKNCDFVFTVKVKFDETISIAIFNHMIADAKNEYYAPLFLLDDDGNVLDALTNE